MTAAQKKVMKALFTGGTIANMGPRNIRLRDKNVNPLGKVNDKTYRKLRGLLRKNARGLWVANARSILKLHAASWVRKEYIKLKTK